jgi:hypothetical protein
MPRLLDGLLSAIRRNGFEEAATNNGIVLRPADVEMATDEFARRIETVEPILDEAGLVSDPRRRNQRAS